MVLVISKITFREELWHPQLVEVKRETNFGWGKFASVIIESDDKDGVLDAKGLTKTTMTHLPPPTPNPVCFIAKYIMK